jgi:hypothetical protein
VPTALVRTWHLFVAPVRATKPVGFTDITRAEYLKAHDEALGPDHRSRAWESLYLEAVRP